jgi:hypothetical protein
MEMRAGKENSLRIWTEELAGEAIDVSAMQTGDQWSDRLIEDLAAGRPGDIPQQAVWDASKISLQAFESAEKKKVVSCQS